VNSKRLKSVEEGTLKSLDLIQGLSIKSVMYDRT
jgi:hypothetical protein